MALRADGIALVLKLPRAGAWTWNAAVEVQSIHTKTYTKENHCSTKLSMSMTHPQLLNPRKNSAYSDQSIVRTSAPINQTIKQCNQTSVLQNPNISGNSNMQKREGAPASA
jgi:hypothetical protein